MAKIAMRFFIIWLQACGLAIFSDSSVGISFPPECNAEGKVGLREIRFQSNHFPIFVDRCIFLHSFEERETKIQMRFSKSGFKRIASRSSAISALTSLFWL